MSGEANQVIIFGLSIDKDIALLVLGAIIGFGASLGTNWINNRTQRKKEEKEKAINIIADTVKFISKSKDIIEDIETEEFHLFEMRAAKQNIAVEAKKFIKKLEEKLDNFSFERKFCSFQLKRLDNKKMWKEFETLVEKFGNYYEYLSLAITTDTFKPSSRAQVEFERLYEIFINHCIDISKIDTPIRTPGAPSKKKGLAEKG